MTKRFAFLILSIIVSMMCVQVTAQVDPVLGKALFKEKCTACHHLEMRLVGPALSGVNERHDEEWLLRFIKSSQSVIASGDSTAISLFNTYNKVPMPDQDLTDADIRSLLAYISEGDKAPGPTGIQRPAAEATSSIRPMKFSDYRFWILYTVTVVLVIIAVYFKAEAADLKNRLEQAAETTE